MPKPDANSTWFHFAVSGGPDFAVFAFSGRERVNRPFSFSIDLASPFAEEDLGGLVGLEACLTIADRSGVRRPVHGVIREMEQLHTANLRTLYRCHLVPRLWFLGLRRNHRIFQHQSAPNIIGRILEEQNFTADSFAFKCFHDYPEREYCVQYGESDLHFISRLCEEEGIYYYFEHTENGHCLCFSDMPGGPRIAGEAALRYFPGSGQPTDTAVVSRATILSRSVSDRATLRDWNFLTPSTILESSAFEATFDKAPAVPGMRAETYRSPHLYQTREEGARHAALQLRRQLTFQTCLEAEADVSRFLPGFTFTLFGHERAELNAGWWIAGVAHQGEQPQVLEHEAPDRGMRYASTVTAIPDTVRYVPEIAHPRNRIAGVQTAIVTGPADEEIYPDAYGRVKVQFFWDREGKQDENTCCWIRVSQGWAGTEFGAMALPRIGQEVIVSFLEGDPDRPLITGRLYNAGAMPPHPLPAHKTRTVLRSMSSPGGDGPGGFNELRLEDKAGEEEMYLHAEKDVNIHIKNDWKEHILRDKHVSVDLHAYVRTQRETHETLDGARKTELHANDNLILRATSHAAIDGSWLCRVGAETHLYAGETAVFEAGTEATLKGGASWIRFTPSGVAAGGSSVSLGGGKSPAGGTPAAPLAPLATRAVAAEVCPVASLLCLQVAREQDAPFAGSCSAGCGQGAEQ